MYLCVCAHVHNVRVHIHVLYITYIGKKSLDEGVGDKKAQPAKQGSLDSNNGNNSSGDERKHSFSLGDVEEALSDDAPKKKVTPGTHTRTDARTRTHTHTHTHMQLFKNNFPFKSSVLNYQFLMYVALITCHTKDWFQH